MGIEILPQETPGDKREELVRRIEDDKVDNTELLDETASRELRKKFIDAFLKDWDGKGFMWDSFNRELEKMGRSLSDSQGRTDMDDRSRLIGELLGKYVSNPEDGIFFMLSFGRTVASMPFSNFEYFADKVLWKLSEFYFFDKSFSWTICVTHDEVIMVLEK